MLVVRTNKEVRNLSSKWNRVLNLISLFFLFAVFTGCLPGKPISTTKSNSYYKWLGGIYYSPNGNWFELAFTKTKADSKSFKILTEDIAKDKNYIFHSGEIQHQVDYESFYIDSQGTPKDKNYVYLSERYLGLKPLNIPEVDVKSFRYINNDGFKYFSNDESNYYYNNKILSVDYISFRKESNYFYSDKDSIYVDFRGWKFIAISPKYAPVKVLNDEYILASDTLYYLNRCGKMKVAKVQLKEVETFRIISKHILQINSKIIYYGALFKQDDYDADSFEVVVDKGENCKMVYSKDKGHVFLDQELIVSADPKSFKILDYSIYPSYSRDRYNVYFKGKPLKNVNPNKFIVLDYYFSKDDDNVYFEDTILEGADAQSFRKESKYSVFWIDDSGNRYNNRGEKI